MQTSSRRDGSAPGAPRPGVTQRQQSAGPAAGKTGNGAQHAKKKQAKGVAEVSLPPCSTVRALPDDGAAYAALLCTAINQQADCYLSPLNLKGTAGCSLPAAELCSSRRLSANASRCTAQKGCLPHGVPQHACDHSAASTCRARLLRPRGTQHQGLWPQSRSTQSLESGRARPALEPCRWAGAVLGSGQWCYCMPAGFIGPAMHCLERPSQGEDSARNASACRQSKQLSCTPFWG